MILSTLTRSDRWSAAAACALAASLAGCLAPRDAAADGVTSSRVLVKLVRASDDPAAIAREASRVAGVPVTYAAAASPAWHALSLHCAGAERCEDAIARLRAAAGIYQAVEVDGRKTRSAS